MCNTKNLNIFFFVLLIIIKDGIRKKTFKILKKLFFNLKKKYPKKIEKCFQKQFSNDNLIFIRKHFQVESNSNPPRIILK